ncbi:hypothetical protein T11_6780 [Trichinella zimbabwensis]|uniref:Transmembrane protein n=1 Tax=Trichinella zimbabwensis TaxID=268475 RepID=A0A0V1HPN7_9BILA|nr:hypothetical protein T11_6780 [Trichinella zimbabwensis]
MGRSIIGKWNARHVQAVPGERANNSKCHYFHRMFRRDEVALTRAEAVRSPLGWVRLATVIGYICAVCLPAVALSVYYVGFWDPHYKEKFPPNSSFALSNLGAASASNSGSEIKTPCNAYNIEGTKRKLSPPSRVKQNIRMMKVNNTRDSAMAQSKMSPPKRLVPS